MSEPSKIELYVKHPWMEHSIWIETFDGFEAARQHVAKMREAYHTLGFGSASDAKFSLHFQGGDPILQQPAS